METTIKELLALLELTGSKKEELEYYERDYLPFLSKEKALQLKNRLVTLYEQIKMYDNKLKEFDDLETKREIYDRIFTKD